MKVLILKTGYSETLDPEIGKSVSLGDVLRSTVIIHPFRHDKITWVTDKLAAPLLQGIEALDRVLFWDFNTALQLMCEKFDVVVNLEKTPSVAALASRVKAWQFFGFRFDDGLGEAQPYRESIQAFDTYIASEIKKTAQRPWEEVLFEMLGMTWAGEKYLLGIKPTTEPIKGRVGLNHKAGGKFPGKIWPYFESLYMAMAPHCSWQEGDNLQDYVNWLNSCEVVVTNDSLGLHLAIALEKKFVALFGPTSAHEVHGYGLGTKIVAPDGDLNKLSVERVRKGVEELLAA